MKIFEIKSYDGITCEFIKANSQEENVQRVWS